MNKVFKNINCGGEKTITKRERGKLNSVLAKNNENAEKRDQCILTSQLN